MSRQANLIISMNKKRKSEDRDYLRISWRLFESNFVSIHLRGHFFPEYNAWRHMFPSLAEFTRVNTLTEHLLLLLYSM